MLFVKHILLPTPRGATVRLCGLAAGLALVAVSGLASAQNDAAPIAPGESRIDLPRAADVPPPPAAPAVQPSVNDVGTGTALRSLIASDKSIPTKDINVTVAGNVATLRGSVPSLFIRDRVVELAQSMRGIERVENLLAVSGPAREDAAILRDVNATLANDPVAGPLRIGVGVQGGEVTLSGNVDRWQTQEHVTSLVKGIPGVRGINSRLAFTTTEQPDKQIVAEVQRRLNQDAWIDPGLVQVKVKNGVVTLNGTVGSAFERNRAITDAWVEGVNGVSADALRVDVAARSEMLRPANGQQPSDQDIRGALSNAFAYSPRLLSFNPEIRVHNGVVTLDGVVDTPEAKREAESIASGVYGVRSVQNELEVRNAATTTTQEAAAEAETPPLVAKFREAVSKDPQLKTFQLSSSVSDDGFRIYGIVDTEAKKARAEKLAASLPGVDKVVSKIRVSENWQVTDSGLRPSDEQIRQATEEALAWNPYIDPGAISIGVLNGVVTLDGSVNNWRDSNMAVRAARLSGATDVQNNLKVAVTAAEEDRQAEAAAAATETGAVVPVPGQNVAAGGAATGVPGAAAPGTAAAGRMPVNSGIDVAYDNGLGVALVPGGVLGTGATGQNTGTPQSSTSVQPENVAVPGTTTNNPTNPSMTVPGIAGVPGAGGSDPNVAAVPGSAGLTAPGTDQATTPSTTTPGNGTTVPAPAPTPPATPVPAPSAPATSTPAAPAVPATPPAGAGTTASGGAGGATGGAGTTAGAGAGGGAKR